jgi:hypothetical protein
LPEKSLSVGESRSPLDPSSGQRTPGVCGQTVNATSSSATSSDTPKQVGTVATPGSRKRRTVEVIEQLKRERTCSTEKEKLMASPTTFRSPYVHRLELVRDTITLHTKLGDKEASELAEHVLDTLNSIPEKVR